MRRTCYPMMISACEAVVGKVLAFSFTPGFSPVMQWCTDKETVSTVSHRLKPNGRKTVETVPP